MMFGGIEKAAISMLRALPPDAYDVTLLLMSRRGELLENIPPWVDVQEVPLSPAHRVEWDQGRKTALRQALQAGNLKGMLSICIRYGQMKLRLGEPARLLAYFRHILPPGPIVPRTYDCAIAYANPQQLFLVAERIHARQKIAWLHTELSRAGFDMRPYRAYLAKCDHVFGVSKSICEAFKGSLPGLAGRVDVAYNHVDAETVRNLAAQGAGFEDDFLGIRILSIGRVSPQKGFDLALAVAQRLAAAGHVFRWYVVGEGPDRERLAQAAAACGLREQFQLLGLRRNPFPFLASCDLYVQPSRYEGYSLTVHEARIFAKPILCTDFAGAREQLEDKRTGLIVPCDVEAIYQGVERLVEDPTLRQELSRNLAAQPVNSGDCIERLRQVLGK